MQNDTEKKNAFDGSHVVSVSGTDCNCHDWDGPNKQSNKIPNDSNTGDKKMIKAIKIILFVVILSLGLYVLFEVSGMFEDEFQLSKSETHLNNSSIGFGVGVGVKDSDKIFSIINASFLKDSSNSKIKFFHNLPKKDLDRMVYREDRFFKIPLNEDPFETLSKHALKVKANVVIMNFYETRKEG